MNREVHLPAGYPRAIYSPTMLRREWSFAIVARLDAPEAGSPSRVCGYALPPHPRQHACSHATLHLQAPTIEQRGRWGGPTQRQGNACTVLAGREQVLGQANAQRMGRERGDREPAIDAGNADQKLEAAVAHIDQLKIKSSGAST